MKLGNLFFEPNLPESEKIQFAVAADAVVAQNLLKNADLTFLNQNACAKWHQIVHTEL